MRGQSRQQRYGLPPAGELLIHQTFTDSSSGPALSYVAIEGGHDPPLLPRNSVYWEDWLFSILGSGCLCVRVCVYLCVMSEGREGGAGHCLLPGER